MQSDDEDFGIALTKDTVRLERLLPGPVERVWAYLTQSDKRRLWLAAGSMDLRMGGAVKLNFLHRELSPGEPLPDRYKDMENGTVVEGNITACEPPRLLSFTWGGAFPGISEVTFQLTPKGDKVLFVVTHRRLDTRAGFISVAAGWHTHVGLLIDHLQGIAPRPFWATHGLLEKDYEKRLP
jgi:uncharacterized protein YndB with AHSA1/START domain